MPAKTKRKRTPGRFLRVLEQFRRDIVCGSYAPGDRLPTFEHLIKAYDVSRATMQQVVRQLRDEGFIRSVSREGIFVADPPPYLNRFAVVYPSMPGERGWSRFHKAFRAECENLFRKHPQIVIEQYFDVHPHLPGADYERLLEDIRCQRLAGLMLHRDTSFLLEHPDVRDSGMPVVGVYYTPQELPGHPVVNSNYAMFLERMFDVFKQKNRQRLACLTMKSFNHQLTLERIREEGLQTPPQWMCSTGRDHENHVGGLVRLLFDYPPEERPDALAIVDDNLVEETLGTLISMGLLVGRDLDVVIHCNWPLPAPSFLPVTHLGVHIHDFLYLAIKLILAQRLGKKLQGEMLVPDIFEQEMRVREPLNFDLKELLAEAREFVAEPAEVSAV